MVRKQVPHKPCARFGTALPKVSALVCCDTGRDKYVSEGVNQSSSLGKLMRSRVYEAEGVRRVTISDADRPQGNGKRERIFFISLSSFA